MRKLNRQWWSAVRRSRYQQVSLKTSHLPLAMTHPSWVWKMWRTWPQMSRSKQKVDLSMARSQSKQHGRKSMERSYMTSGGISFPQRSTWKCNSNRQWRSVSQTTLSTGKLNRMLSGASLPTITHCTLTPTIHWTQACLKSLTPESRLLSSKTLALSICSSPTLNHSTWQVRNSRMTNTSGSKKKQVATIMSLVDSACSWRKQSLMWLGSELDLKLS